MKPIITTMTALAVALTSLPSAQAAMAMNKPMNMNAAKPQAFKIKPPRIHVRRQLTKPMRIERKSDRPSKTEAGPQPEPPTKPVPGTEVSLNIPPLPRARPTLPREPSDTSYNEFDEGGAAPGGEVNTTGILPPPLDMSPELTGLLDITGGNLGDVLDAVKLLEDGPGGQNALPEHFRDQGDDIPGVGGDHPFGGGRIGAWDPLGGGGTAFGPGGRNEDFGADPMAGIPKSPASKAPGSGGRASDGWTWDGMVTGTTGSGSTESWTRAGSNGSTVKFTRDEHGDGAISIGIQVTDSEGNVQGEVSIDISAPNKDGSRDYQAQAFDAEGNHVGGSKGTTNTESVPNQYDTDGDGVPDDTTAGGGDQGSETTNNEHGICNGWNPLNGCAAPGVKIEDSTSQPNPTDDGSATVRSAAASIGPEAVTNGGDGSFVSGQGRAGGGSGLDPCATVAGCGGGGDGPEGPGGPDRPDR
jgi:hypothetical protein